MPVRKARPPSSRLPPLPKHGECPCCREMVVELEKWRRVLEGHLEYLASIGEYVEVTGTEKINGVELNDTDPSDDDVLTYDAFTGKAGWEALPP